MIFSAVKKAGRDLRRSDRTATGYRRFAMIRLPEKSRNGWLKYPNSHPDPPVDEPPGRQNC
jgi:hypothetical protein